MALVDPDSQISEIVAVFYDLSVLKFLILKLKGSLFCHFQCVSHTFEWSYLLSGLNDLSGFHINNRAYSCTMPAGVWNGWF